MMKAQAASNLDHLTGLETTLLDRQLVLNGVFKDEIARLLQVQADAEAKLGMVDTVAAADQYRKDADAYAAKTRGAADSALAAAQDALAKANAKMDAALTKEKSVASRENQALGLMEDYHAKADAFDSDCAKREAAIASREAALRAAQEQLAKDKGEWSQKQAAMAEKLRAAQELAKSA